MSTYEQRRADFEYLEGLAEVEDMVTIDAEVFALMRDPSKRKAGELYASCIALWFQEHGDKPKWQDAADVQDIAERNGQ